MPVGSKTAVLRFAPGRSAGSGKTRTSSVAASTRTIAFRPPSVIQAAPSGPVMTPCGAEPAPSGISRTSPVAGSRWPRRPSCWPVYQTPPSAAGATSCGWEPAGTSNSRISSVTASGAALEVAGAEAGGEAGAVADARPPDGGAAVPDGWTAGVVAGDPHAAATAVTTAMSPAAIQDRRRSPDGRSRVRAGMAEVCAAFPENVQRAPPAAASTQAAVGTFPAASMYTTASSMPSTPSMSLMASSMNAPMPHAPSPIDVAAR